MRLILSKNRMRRAVLSALLSLLAFAAFSGQSRTGVRVQSRPRQRESTTLERQRDVRSALQVRHRWRQTDVRGALHSSSQSSHSAVGRDSAGRTRERLELDDELEVPQSRTDGDDEVGAGAVAGSARGLSDADSMPRVRAAHRHTAANELPHQRKRRPHQRNSDSAVGHYEARAAHFQDFQLGMGPW